MNYFNKNVLLVDDDPDVLEQQNVLLKSLGFNTVCASGESEAMDILKSFKPDLAVIDLMMEEMDGGFILAYEIKKISNDIPVIMTTAVTNVTGMEFENSSLEEKNWIKADVILPKPVRFEQLKGEIQRLFMED
ncbi:MAG: response regulator [Deltaproteobacteria bacterium]|nr:response regulator [Deltaproteobacteria bacterium]